MRIDLDHLPNFGTANSGPRVGKNECSSSRMRFRTLTQVTVLLNPDPPYEQAQWQESEPAARLLEGDDAAGCGLLCE